MIHLPLFRPTDALKTLQNFFCHIFALSRSYVGERNGNNVKEQSHSSGFTITLVIIQFWNAFELPEDLSAYNKVDLFLVKYRISYILPTLQSVCPITNLGTIQVCLRCSHSFFFLKCYQSQKIHFSNIQKF